MRVLHNMRPPSAANNVPSMLLGNAEGFTQFGVGNTGVGFMVSTKCTHDIFGDGGHRMSGPATKALGVLTRTVARSSRGRLGVQSHPVCIAARITTFRQHVVHIVLVGARKQVGGIDTATIVAPVANVQAIANHATTEDKCQSMGEVSLVPDAKSTVAIACTTALPNPTGVSPAAAVNLRPKSVDNLLGILGVRHTSLLRRLAGVTHRAVTSSAGAFATLNYTILTHKMAITGMAALAGPVSVEETP